VSSGGSRRSMVQDKPRQKGHPERCAVVPLPKENIAPSEVSRGSIDLRGCPLQPIPMLTTNSRNPPPRAGGLNIATAIGIVTSYRKRDLDGQDSQA